jgi:hypothetical protein
MVVALLIALTMREKPLAGRTATPGSPAVSAPAEADLATLAH